MARYKDSYGFGGYQLTPWVKKLLIANFAVFILGLVAPLITDYMGFAPDAVLWRPWTILTYAFVHGGFMHIFFNMLALFFFGPPLENRWGSREFIKYYLICALGGAALSFVFAFHSTVVGASAAVYGIMLAFAMVWPDVPIYIYGIFPIKAKWLVGALAALSFFSAFRPGVGDNTAHFAHLGGFLFGFLYIKFDKATGNPLQKLRKVFARRRLKVVKGSATVTPMNARPTRKRDEDR
ncbi:MAG TPA: rhomboid family intramembrane serine protease, partial [Longimicrobiales bacterium]|nr:rhomboid family intramembrane serine protease [Longimicrobiales bacterium]